MEWTFGADIMKSMYPNIVCALRKYDNGLNETIHMATFYLLHTVYSWSMEQLYYWSSDSTLNEGLCDVYRSIADLYGNNKA